MDMTGEYRIAASRERVWAALNDPETLRRAIPGCEELTKLSDTEMEATARAKIGPVSARFKGKVVLSDLKPGEGYTLTGEGSGGAAGFAKGEAKVTLSPDGDGTVLRYTVKATIGGKLAQIGQRLVDGAAKKMADDFFEQFAVLAAGPPPEPAAPAAAATQPAPVIAANENNSPLSPLASPRVWIPALVIVAGLVLLIATLMH